LIEKLKESFDLTEVQEITFEANPYPYAETLHAYRQLQDYCKDIPRVRFSFGIQSLHNDTLEVANRETTFEALQQFTLDIVAQRGENTVINYDFIAFGDKELLPQQKEWLEKLVASKAIQSFSLYTLEIFP
jgi:coproporphyrinogen III oxidase-like Fe-S oxidoreductase